MTLFHLLRGVWLRLRFARFVVHCAGGGPGPALEVFNKFTADMTPQAASPYLFNAPPVISARDVPNPAMSSGFVSELNDVFLWGV